MDFAEFANECEDDDDDDDEDGAMLFDNRIGTPSCWCATWLDIVFYHI